MLDSYTCLWSASCSSPLYTLPYLALNASHLSSEARVAASVCTSRQIALSPFWSSPVRWMSTLARLAGMDALVVTFTGRLRVPALRGKGRAGTTMLPVLRGRLQVMSEVPSPLQSVSCVPRAEMVALMEAEVTSSSMVPVPVMVAVVPVEKEVGDNELTFPCLEPAARQPHLGQGT